MSITTDNVIRVLEAGGNISVDASGRKTDSILRIIATAKNMNKKITFRNCTAIKTDNILRIIEAGGDDVFLEV